MYETKIDKEIKKNICVKKQDGFENWNGYFYTYVSIHRVFTVEYLNTEKLYSITDAISN